MDRGARPEVWDIYVKAGMPQWDPLTKPIDRPLHLAEMTIINDNKIPHNLIPENWVMSYKLHNLAEGLPKDCRVAVFHGKPKPHDCLRNQFVKENWHA
jgi:hypothetical protein